MDEATRAYDTLRKLEDALAAMDPAFVQRLDAGRRYARRATRYALIVTRVTKVLALFAWAVFFLATVTNTGRYQMVAMPIAPDGTPMPTTAPSPFLRLLRQVPYLAFVALVLFAFVRYFVGLPYRSLFFLIWLPYYALDRRIDQLAAANACTYAEYADACRARGADPVVNMEEFTPETVGKLAGEVRSGRAATVADAWDAIRLDERLR